MENETSELKIGRGVNVTYAVFAGVGILLIALGFLYGLRLLNPTVESKQLDADLPPLGWNVTDDLGVGEVPGGPPAQRFELRQNEGWEVLAYCLEPEVTPPPVGTPCELIDENTFWCGDDFQQLREYEILQQPPPEQTETETPTATVTNTTTATPTLTQTPAATNTPMNTPTNIAVPTQSFTPTPRPKMGGDGNLRLGDAISLITGLVMIGIGISFAVLDWKHLAAKAKKE